MESFQQAAVPFASVRGKRPSAALSLLKMDGIEQAGDIVHGEACAGGQSFGTGWRISSNLR